MNFGALRKGSSFRATPRRVASRVAYLIERLAEAAEKDLVLRYEIGKFAHDLRYDILDDMGSQSFIDVARALNIAPDTLRGYARLAEMMGAREFGEYLALRNRFGMPMTWSHVEELAKCRSALLRRRCAEEVASENLSVRELAKRWRAGMNHDERGGR